MNGACCSCEEMERIVKAEVERVLASVGAKGGGERRKRAPSAYNMFIKECMGGGKSDMKTCAVDYKTLSTEQKAKYKAQAQAAQ